ncbi:Oidioi.mRNA.OKI2018_I69.chr2.g4902.t1.cds [Oikopleura dioica]|uniref:Oidioi.mRNA.OKI2018_I69.chr2.g4902.t1.cds n=1 Tax=Oikopleura dioica TaxID=34765 RepID=A0ABN7T599_OIKDI|nr:Oidioi.mRNA.OKI2018_I69.chr2.g4902.t1.cds [Oikopleura dioica]
MKIFALTLAALATAQRKKNKNNKNNNYAPTTDAPTDAPETTMDPYVEPTNAYGGGAGGAYGDPHFMVQSPAQEPLCFDFNPTEGTDMNLLVDPESALAITATAKARDNGKVFMNSIHFQSPAGAHLEFDIDGVHLAGLGDRIVSDPHPLTGAQTYGDINFIEKWTVDGIIGQFIRDDSYFIQDNGDETALVTSGGMSVEATRENFHHTDNCWVINDQDMLFMMANL